VEEEGYGARRATSKKKPRDVSSRDQVVNSRKSNGKRILKRKGSSIKSKSNTANQKSGALLLALEACRKASEHSLGTAEEREACAKIR